MAKLSFPGGSNVAKMRGEVEARMTKFKGDRLDPRQELPVRSLPLPNANAPSRGGAAKKRRSS